MLERERQYLLDRPDVFISRYFGHRLGLPLEDFHLALIEAVTTRPRSLILFPATHGKTTIASTLLPIWELCRDPNIRIALILKNDTDARGVMQAIIAELLGNESLIRDFGPFRPEDRETPFGFTALTVVQRTMVAKEPTISAYGSGSRSALGSRTDLTVCDDIIHDKNSATPEARAKIKEWFNQGPETQGEDEDDRLSVVGTLFHPEDLYGDLMCIFDPETGLPVWHVEHWDAITDEEEHQVLWPARWPWKRLMAKKAAIGTLDFNKRYRNMAVDPSRMAFREEYIKGGYVGKLHFPGCLDRKYKVGDYDPSWPRYSGFDPAIGTYRTAKFCAHITLAVGSCALHERCYWVVDLVRDQMSLPQQVELILSQHDRYETFVSRVEANSYQAGLLDECNRRMTESGKRFKIEPHYTTRVNKPDPELGVLSMAPVFENGEVHIPWSNPESMRKMQILVDELVQYPSGRTTDTCMAFWFAWRAAQERMPLFKSVNRLHDGPNKHFWRQQTKRRTLKNPYYDDKVAVES